MSGRVAIAEPLLTFLVLVTLSVVVNSLTFYDGINHSGRHYSVPIAWTTHEQCHNLPSQFNNTASSISNGHCVHIYDGSDCTGKDFQLKIADSNGLNLTLIDMDKKVSSFKGCHWRIHDKNPKESAVINLTHTPNATDTKER